MDFVNDQDCARLLGMILLMIFKIMVLMQSKLVSSERKITQNLLKTL